MSHELYFGAFKSQKRERNLATVHGLRFEILAFDHDDARHAGEIRALLSAQCAPIGGYDVLIAGLKTGKAEPCFDLLRNFAQDRQH